MSKDSLWTKCKTCNENISASAKACPKCGAQLQKPKTRHWLVIPLGLIAVLMVIGALTDKGKTEASSTGETAPSPAQQSSSQPVKKLQNPLPDDQQLFIGTVEGYARSFGQAKNELQQSLQRDERRSKISGVIKSLNITGWAGTITRLETNSDGKAILSVEIAPDITLSTWNNAISDISSSTLIEKSSPLYGTLVNLSKGDKVVFSGRFFPSDKDSVQEKSLTIHGSMNDPDFLFKFSSVTPR